jgi:hypothetical protein
MPAPIPIIKQLINKGKVIINNILVPTLSFFTPSPIKKLTIPVAKQRLPTIKAGIILPTAKHNIVAKIIGNIIKK